MLFSEQDAPLLKKWIVKRLENTSDADADVLADYVLALLRHEGTIGEVRALCEAEIPDFLKEDSTIFVRDVFDTIQYKSYVPGAAPPPRPPIAFAPPAGPSAHSYGNLVMNAPVGPSNGSRKRSYNDRGDGDAQDRGLQQGNDPNARSYKQARRGSSTTGRGNYHSGNGRGRGFGGSHAPATDFQIPIPQGLGNMPGLPSPPPGLPNFDPNNPMAAMMAMQAMGFPVPGMPQLPQANSPGASGSSQASIGRKARCRDYDEKGFCSRGNQCKFEHDQHSIWVPPTKRQDEYDPSNAAIVEGNGTGIPNFKLGAGKERGGFTSRGDRGGQRGGNSSRRGGRSEFSSDRPNYDKSNTTIVVENIPEDKFTEDEIKNFFSEFGNVAEITMRPYKRLSIVKFDDWNSAKAAYNSPKVIFDNRFVKVYWYLNQESLPKPPTVSASNDFSNDALEMSTPTAARKMSEPQIDIEEFTRKQLEVQKAHEEKMRKKEEMEVAKKELEKRQEDLLKNQAEEKRKLLERIAAKSAKSGLPLTGKENGSPTPAEDKPSEQTSILKAQLAALEAEAQSLGIDSSLGEESPFSGRGRGRGRGAYRGRGAFVPRGYRGGFRGRGGAPFGGGSAYRLDNRPKKVALTGIDFTDGDKDENLRQYLLGIGEFVDIETTPSRTSITFKDRFTAEKFMYTTTNGEIPSVGTVEMTWVQTPLPPINLATLKSHPAGATSGVDDMQMTDEGDATMNTSSLPHGNDRDMQENIDYDVADDNDWGPE